MNLNFPGLRLAFTLGSFIKPSPAEVQCRRKKRPKQNPLPTVEIEVKYVFNEEGEQQFPLLRIQRKRVPRWGTMAFEELATHKLKKKKKANVRSIF